MATEAPLRVTVVHAPTSRALCEVELLLAPGTRVEEALQRSGLMERFTDLARRGGALGIWGRACTLEHVLRDRDRLEIYRPLLVDPKVARRERFVKQGVRAPGLFAKRRSGAKAGY